MARWKILTLLFYVAAAGAALAIPSLRRNRGAHLIGADRSLLLRTGVARFGKVLDLHGKYLTLAGRACGSGGGLALPEEHPSAPCAGGGSCGARSIPNGWEILKIRQNTYGNDYDPAIRFLRSHASHGALIMGGRNSSSISVKDIALWTTRAWAYGSGRTPDVIVKDFFHTGPPQFELQEPDTARYLSDLLKHYHLAAEFGEDSPYRPGYYRILIRNKTANPASD